MDFRILIVLLFVTAAIGQESAIEAEFEEVTDTPLDQESIWTNESETSFTTVSAFNESISTSTEEELNSTGSTSETPEESSTSENTTFLVTTAEEPCQLKCQNGGECEETKEGAFMCSCPSSFVGKFCQTQDFCVEDENGHLCNSGACAYSEDMSYRYCKCFHGAVWDQLTQVCSEAEPPCLPNPCKNGGTCRMDLTEAYRCICTKGFEGPNCEVRYHCEQDEITGELCGSNGTCVLDASGTERRCSCPQGFYLHEASGLCREANPPCEPNPCNRHECTPLHEGGFNCSCDATNFGPRCEIANNCSGLEDQLVCVNGLCLLNEKKTAWTCHCNEGFVFDALTAHCREIAKPCFPNPCANEGTCVAVSEEDYTCSCAEGFTGEQCAVRDRCVLDGGSAFCGEATCFMDEPRGTMGCMCEEGKYFDYSSRRCLVLDLCLLIKCGHNEECVNNTCRCLQGFKRGADADECIADFCALVGCPHASMACEENEEEPTAFRCFCPPGEAFDGEECSAAACSFPSLNDCEQRCETDPEGFHCLCHPEFSLKHNNRSCEFTGEVICSNKTCGVGVCFFQNALVKCACPPGYVEMNDTCVDLCTAGQLPEGLCPEDACEADPQKGFRCKCGGELYGSASDGVTCTAKRPCARGEIGWTSCAEKRAQCIEKTDGRSYSCLCAPGWQEYGGICTRICAIDENRERCFRLGAECGLDENFKFLCRCPPGFAKDSDGLCNAIAPLSFLVTLPVDLTVMAPEEKRSRLWEGSDSKTVFLQVQIFRSMKRQFGGLLQVNVLNCKAMADYTLCKVEVQLSYLSEEESFNRLLMTSSCAHNESLSDKLCLLPPSMVLRKDRIPSDVSFRQMDVCDEDVKRELCDLAASCESFEGGFTCKCGSGFRVRRRSFPVKDDPRTFAESCIDVDECAEDQPCPPNLACTNTVGSYRCSCLPGYRESNGSQSGCVELCHPNPCLHGDCLPLSQSTFECSCEPGYAGFLCNYEDKNYKGAVVNTIIVGVVLGGILLITVILFFSSVARLRKRKFSDEPSHVLYSSEMLERRPVRLSAANPAFERD